MKINKKILKNGLRIVTVPMKDNPTVTVLVLVEAGSKYETKENNGISHFLEHMCFKGTKNRETSYDITKELDGLGAQTNAFTGHEFTGFYAKVQQKHLLKVLDVISDVYLHATFPEAELEKEKGVILDEIGMYEDLPQHIVHEIFMELMYGDQPVGWQILGPKENVKNMTREAIVAYKAGLYKASATTVIVTGGGFESAKIVKTIEKKFESIPEGKKGSKKKVIEKQDKPKITIRYKKTDQTHIIVGLRSLKSGHKDSAVLSVVSTLLGSGMSSRLFRKLRDEMGVGYYVSASKDSFTDHGIFSVSTGVNNERAPEVVEAILGEFARLKTELVADKELKKVKDYIGGHMLLGLESSDSIAEFVGVQEILNRPIKLPKEFIKEINAVTPKDILRVSKQIFKNEKLNLAIIGPFKDGKKFSKKFKFK